MTFDTFRESIRLDVLNAVYTTSRATEYINRRGWHTTRDVPEERRAEVLDALRAGRQ